LNIPFFEYPRLFKDEQKLIMDVIHDIGVRGAYILQNDLSDFEKTLSEYLGTKNAIGVANATDGLEIAWTAIGLKPGDEVIISAHTMLATASSIVVSGGVPVPVDIGTDNLIDPSAVEAAITSRTVGISPTQLNGRTCDMDSIMKIASKYKLSVVEDAAQGLGSSFKGKRAGSFGDVAAFSFYPAKILGCLGDGGAVTTSNHQLFEKMFQLHDHGRDAQGITRSWGRNSRLDNLQAAILNYRFTSFDSTIQRRRTIAQIYHENLSMIRELKLPHPPNNSGYHYDTFQNYEIEAENRNNLQVFLKDQGVGTLVQWGGKAIHQWDHVESSESLPRVETFFNKCLMLPINLFISDEDVVYICEKIHEFYFKNPS
jgi:dTDP-4-amino-4,6-dideoxygalactose transaminase